MNDIHHRRYNIIQGLIIATSLALMAKCFILQIWDNKGRESSSYTEEIPIYPARGLVFDRNGKQMVSNEATYDVLVTYNLIGKKLDTVKFCQLLGITREEFKTNLNKDFKRDKRFSKNKPYVFLKNVPAAVFARFSESLYEFPGFEGQLRNVRGYDDKLGAHVLGYISEVTDRQIKESNGKYRRGDYIGTSGIESKYEDQLRGKNGVKRVLIDNLGRMRGSYKDGVTDTIAESGLYLISSLDMELQRYGEELMNGKKGSIVAIEPSTGEILALVSTPTYDPNLLTITRDRGAAFHALSTNDSLKPLLNRAIQSKYPPGSIFKTVIALIGLQEGVLTKDRGVACHGGWMSKPRVGCHGHPYCSNPSMAIQHSCNAYFCQTFRELVEKYGFNEADKGLDIVTEYMNRFGLGRKLGLDLPNELGGFIPNTPFYDKMYRKGGWHAPTIISMGIGQGEVLMTPLQMANLAAILANRGWFYTPHLVKEFKPSQEHNDRELAAKLNQEILGHYKERHQTNIDTAHYNLVIKGLEDVLLAGTARSSRVENISICGKTGTVQNPHGKNHSAFIAFAPRDNPKIAIAVFVENSGQGAHFAAPISSLMIEKYLTRTITGEARIAIENKMKNSNLINSKN